MPIKDDVIWPKDGVQPELRFIYNPHKPTLHISQEKPKRKA